MALVAHWKLDEALAPNVAADAVAGRNLTPTGDPAVRAGRIAGGNARTFAAGQYLSGTDTAFDLWTAADWSLSWWMVMSTVSSVERAILNITKGADPTQIFAEVFLTAAEYPGVRWTSVSDTTTTSQGLASTAILPATQAWNHHAVTRVGTTINFYLNGALVVSRTLADRDISVDFNDSLIRIGRGGTAGTVEAAGLSIDDVRFYTHALTAEEVQALAWPDGAVAGDTTDPVISNVSPAPGVISPTSTWSFRVTDNTAFRKRMVTVDYANGSSEIVYRDDATGFRQAFSAGSTITEVTPGKVYDLVIRRAGSFPSPPIFNVDAIDTAGNEAT